LRSREAVARNDRDTVVGAALRRPPQRLTDVFRRAAHPGLGETERDHRRIVADRGQRVLHEADGPGVDRLRRVAAVLRIGEERGAARESDLTLARLNIEESQFERRGRRGLRRDNSRRGDDGDEYEETKTKGTHRKLLRLAPPPRRIGQRG
jgi:hypothetical protein